MDILGRLFPAIALQRSGVRFPSAPPARRADMSGHVEHRLTNGVSGRDSIASLAGAQVQGILEAAQASAQAIEADASEQAQRARDEAAAEASRTREQAVAKAQELLAAVTAATEALLQRVGSMDGETRTLVESLRGGAGRLVSDLEAVAVEMGALYDAAGGRATGPAAAAAEPVPAQPGTSPQATAATSQNGVGAAAATAVPTAAAEPAQPAVPVARPSQPEQAAAVVPPAAPASDGESTTAAARDVDGARLVALNMALNGDSREATGRYLAEHFDIAEPEQLLDEVYAAIEG